MGAPAIVATWCGPRAAAQSDPGNQPDAWRWRNEDKVSPDLRISGCTNVIQSGRESARRMAIAFNNRRNAYCAEKDDDKAIVDATRAIELDPQYGLAYAVCGRADRQKGDTDGALESCEQALKYDANNPRTLNDLGNANHAKKDYGRAIAADPAYPYAYNNRGVGHDEKGAHDLALADDDKALALSPKLAGALFGRRNGRRKRRDPAGREADLAAAKAMRADNTEHWAQYGVR
ncbi:MAG: tetratricopeptide repeat protein [Acetobacteraceae bacterium]|nr:tetratricopeptide repeat protein [Acetobacteraceae bacterium]